MAKNIRLDKYLADMGVGTRSEVKNHVKKGKVTVNGSNVNDPNMKIDREQDTIFFEGHEVCYVTEEYFMLNKPAGVISATEDKNCETVIDLIEDARRKDLFPVGRLDKDTEGLLLITNDGLLAHSLLSPKKHVDKEYYARIEGTVTAEDVHKFKEGLQVDEDFKALPAELKILHSGAMSEILLTIQEGKFHQVKRMFEAVGKQVVYLKRLSMGSLRLDESLRPGEYRALTAEEIKDIMRKR